MSAQNCSNIVGHLLFKPCWFIYRTCYDASVVERQIKRWIHMQHTLYLTDNTK